MNVKILSTLEYHKIIDMLTRHAATELGKGRARRLKPYMDLETASAHLQTTDEAAGVERLKGPPPFGGVRDCADGVKRARIGSMLSPGELLDVLTTLAASRKLKRFLEAIHDDHPIPRLIGLCENIVEHKEVEQAIENCIDDHGDVMDGASPELGRIRSEIRTGEARIRERLEQMVRSSSVQKMLQETIITMRNDRYVLPVKQEYRSNIGGIVHDQSASGATLFIEPEAVVQGNNRLRELRLKEQKEIEKILSMLTGRVAEIADDLNVLLDTLAELDFIFARAGLAHEMKATLPLLNDRGVVRLRKARHPLIPREHVVPINVELGKQYRTMIITGPNTGGKTVTLKTVGLLSLMAMSGLFIPAEDESETCIFDGIFADIGDEQSIEQSLSTFSSHMTNIIRILRDVTPNSLVLLDELGAGTDPAEGSALAIAILEHLHRLRCMLIATTHYSELKAYAYEREGIINASMEFDVQTLSPTYRLLVGIPGRSNAFSIARRLGLSSDIIRHAESYVGESDRKVETMIASLEENRLGAEAERETAAQLRKEVEELRRKLASERDKLAEQRDKILANAEREARDAIAKARREADEIIADLRRMALEEKASVKEHKLIEAKSKLERALPDLQSNQPAIKPKRSAAKVEPGDEVHVLSLNQKGYVVELAGDKEAVVQIGIMKMKVSRTDLEKVKRDRPVQTAVASSVKRTRDDSAKPELDLRGTSVEDAILEVDRFLDESLLANLAQVYIIHGKGTGVLRANISDFLKRHKHVKSYRLGNYGEGGSGVTVVELK